MYTVEHDTSDSQSVEEHPTVIPNAAHDLNRLEPPTRSKQLEIVDFQRFLVLCEQLQSIGTIIYIPSALFLIFYMFERMEFAIVIYAMTSIGAWAVFRLGFWKVSVLWHDLNHVCSRCKAAVGIGKSR